MNGFRLLVVALAATPMLVAGQNQYIQFGGYPQNKHPSQYCPAGTTYKRHACGTAGWKGSGSVQWGPYSSNDYLTGSGHCSTSCNCNTVVVECGPAGGTQYIQVGGYPQNKHPSQYCPAGTSYKRHACGTAGWRGSGYTQWGPYSSNDYLTSSGHCSTSCNCNTVIVECSGAPAAKSYVNFAGYPQNKNPSQYCPAGTTYSRHACGSGANSWKGSGSVQYGPYSTNDYLTGGGHCSCCCNCNSVTVECNGPALPSPTNKPSPPPTDKPTAIPTRGPTMGPTTPPSRMPTMSPTMVPSTPPTVGVTPSVKCKNFAKDFKKGVLTAQQAYDKCILYPYCSGKLKKKGTKVKCKNNSCKKCKNNQACCTQNPLNCVYNPLARKTCS